MVESLLDPFDWSSPTTPAQVQPFRLRGGNRGCLLIHGFAGTPSEVRDLAEELASHGYDVIAPLLAGHGLTPRRMLPTRWTDWVRSAREALEILEDDCAEVFIGGQSLGGSLALYLAARHATIRGIVTMGAIGTTRFFRDPRLRFIWALKHVLRWDVPAASCDLGDPSRLTALHSYRRRPTVCLESLLRLVGEVEQSLPQLRMPALIVHGRRDQTVPVGNATFIMDGISSPDRRLRWLERSGHAVTVDCERQELNHLVREWLDAH